MSDVATENYQEGAPLQATLHRDASLKPWLGWKKSQHRHDALKALTMQFTVECLLF